MQTEAIFQTARTIDTISKALNQAATGVRFTFEAEGGTLYVVLSGAMPHELAAIADEVTGGDDFKLVTDSIGAVSTRFIVKAY